MQVNNREADAEQIAAHEIYHAQNAYFDGKLNEEVKAKIIERFSKEEFEAVVAEYVKALEGVYDVGTGVSETMNQAALELIEEEVLADAYAGINAFGANAGRFFTAAWEKTSELGLGYPGKEMSRELGSGPLVEAQYSISETESGEPVAVVDSDILEDIYDGVWSDAKEEAAMDAAVEALRKFRNGVFVGNVTYNVNRTTRREYTRSNDAKRQLRKDPNGYADKLRAADVLDDVITAVVNWRQDGSLKHSRTDFIDFCRGDVLILSGAAGYSAEVVVGITDNGRFVIYDITHMMPREIRIKNADPSSTATTSYSLGDMLEESASVSLPQTKPEVKESFSLDDSYQDADEARVAYFENVGAQRKQRYEDRVRQEVEAVRRRSEPEPSTENAVYEQSAEEDAERLQYFEDMGAQRKQQYVEGIREAESDARLEYFEQQAAQQPGEDVDPEQVAREVEEMRRRSEPKPEPVEAEEVTPMAREDLPAKARDNLAKEEAAALRGLRNSLGVTQTNAREFLKETVQQISDEYLATGKISQETADRLFEDAWKKGEIEDREFFEQYEHIKEKLRTTAVTLDKRDQSDIADFNKFKQKCYQTLRIVNEGGMPVDSLYEELRGMAPELFPENITHPADQLVRMYEAGKSIVKRKASLDAYYGPEAASMKQYARESFEGAIYGKEGFERKLWAVRRFGSDKAVQAEQKAQKPKVRTLEEALEAGNKMKDARRAAERAVAKNLLTASDEEIVGKLLRGEMSLAQLDPSRDNVEGIRAVYEAKRAYEEAVKPVAEYKRLVHAQLRSKADGFLDTANSWKDKKSGLAYSQMSLS